MTSDPFVPDPPDPSPQELRHPKPGVIDQRQQRIDPAGKHTVDPNDRPPANRKQPGGTAVPEDDVNK